MDLITVKVLQSCMILQVMIGGVWQPAAPFISLEKWNSSISPTSSGSILSKGIIIIEQLSFQMLKMECFMMMTALFVRGWRWVETVAHLCKNCYFAQIIMQALSLFDMQFGRK